MPDARFWGDSEQAFLAALGPGRGPWLAISGGGEDGAFGAGLLNGWTQAGTRPDFSVVTGVSTGALIAPYVFAGSRYDAALRERFTTVSAGDVFEDGATVDSLLDTWPLRDLIARNITPELMADIAAQHRAGRRLFVLTTNLDAGRPTVWNIGAIAAYGGKRALDLIRQVLLASASVPGIFPPVAIDVEANGRNFQELHGDGAINAPLFVAPESMLDKSRLNHLPTQSVYLLMNGKLYPDFMVTPHGKLSVLSRSIGLALQGSMRGEIARVHQAAKEAGIGFNLAYIDSAFDHPSSGIFDRDYMAALFAHGLAQGKSGRPFQTDLPGPQKQTRAEQDR
ncbi:MAG TPA: patatin-like phospholipase family protein [Xanthobacteraceae bacterium]|nr:patatin-like phospholipase family protein [Xanthobacteraceae bacterium]